MAHKGPSLAGRAILAIVLMVGFYLLAIGIALGILAIPVLEVAATGRLHIKLALFCVVGGLVILASVVPRPDTFPEPGPRLEPDKHPRLFAALRGVAEATGQEMPAEVYAIPRVNAFVAQRGGMMGFFSRRVMGLGIPLMQSMTVGELKAVIAHEFGHFHGGDTRLGPFIYKTRSAIGRTVTNLRSTGSSLLHAPFEAYGMLFLRITHGISRAQEFAADRLAATTVGSAPLVSGFEKISAVAAAYDGFLDSELAPAFEGGYRPPMVQGFASFLEAPKVAEAMGTISEGARKEVESDPFDTHPPTAARIEAVEGLEGPAPAPGDDAPAIGLLEPESLAALEKELLYALVGDAALVMEKQEARWEDLGAKLYTPQWAAKAERLAGALPAGCTLAGLSECLEDQKAIAVGLFGPDAQEAPDEVIASAVTNFVGSAVAAKLVADGWDLSAAPGAEVTVTSGERTVAPFELARGLAQGELDAEAWGTRVAELGIGDVVLGADSTEEPT